MDAPPPTTLTVNGQRREVAAKGSAPLLFALRNDLGLTGVRGGCAIGECGACTVLVDGAPTRSCTTPVESVAGADITTPEGLGTPDAPHPIQQAFLDAQAAQCGYCINGMVMTVAAVAGQPPETRERSLDAALAEHICRCGTHVRILRAARRALGIETDEDAPAQVLSPRTGCVAACATTALPDVLSDLPDVQSWIRVLPDGRVEVRTGKVELGQGIRTAMAQLVAAQLELSPSTVLVRSTATSHSPDERYTAGSLSVEQGGMAVATAAVAFRRLLLERAAQHLGVAAEELRLAGAAVVAENGRQVSFAALTAEQPISGRILDSDRAHWHGGPVGAPVARQDLVAKITGAGAYLHDMVLDGMLHARAVLPPSYGARLEDVDDDAAAALPGVVKVIRNGSLLLVVAEREEQAVAAAANLHQSARWSDPGLQLDSSVETTLRALQAQAVTARGDDVDAVARSAPHRRSASYFRPYQAHGAMAPSCAIAVADNGSMTVYSHTQGVYPLRQELAAILGMDAENITVEHADGPGCYGHNCADDAGAFAALAARAVEPAPVRFLMSSADELAWDPFGSAMLADLEAALDDDGHIVAWRHRARTDVHTTRPTGSGDRLIPSWLVGAGRDRPRPRPHETGMRNSIPLYDIAAVESVTDFVAGPLRTSALRSLASHTNVFAIESFLDELAELAGVDPVEFRLAHLSDERARGVLEAAAAAAGWQPHVGPSGRGQGVALCRYKSTKAYVAAVVDARMDAHSGAIAVQRVVVACDAGVVVNPDGLRNQLEGGVIQGLSRALFEQVRADAAGVRSRDWTTYPVLRFSDVPRVDVLLIDAGDPPVGAGEASTPPVAPALANAIDDAIGIRLRSLPLTAEQAQRRLAEMSDEEMARVLLG